MMNDKCPKRNKGALGEAAGEALAPELSPLSGIAVSEAENEIRRDQQRDKSLQDRANDFAKRLGAVLSPNQKKADDFCGRLTGKGNRADEVLRAVTGKSPKREDGKDRGEKERMLASKTGKARGPQLGPRAPRSRS